MGLFDRAADGDGHTSYIRRALRLRWPLGLATMVLALVTGVAGALGIEAIAVHPIAAMCIGGLGFWTIRMKRFGRVPLAQIFIACFVLLICSATVMNVVLAPWIGGGTGPLFGPTGNGSVSFDVSTALVLSAFAIAALLRHGLSRWGTAGFLSGVFVTYAATLQLVFGAGLFAGQVSAASVVQLLCLSGAMASIYVNRPLVRVAFLVGDMGHQTRVVLLASVLVPLAILGAFWSSITPVSTFVAVMAIVTGAMVLTVLRTTAQLELTAVARRRAEREIAMQRRIDPLTKALNRFGMTEALDGAWLDFRTRGSMFGLLLMDLDYFERLNADFGHEAGDDVLARVAQTVQPHLRDTDALGRWGGSEFLILLRIKQESDLQVVTNRLRGAMDDVRSPFYAGLNGDPIQITASFGASVMSEEDRGPSQAVTRADIALHMERDAAADTTALLLSPPERRRISAA